MCLARSQIKSLARAQIEGSRLLPHKPSLVPILGTQHDEEGIGTIASRFQMLSTGLVARRQVTACSCGTIAANLSEFIREPLA